MMPPTAESSSSTQRCQTCDKPADSSTKLSRCGRCQSTFYCSQDCQKSDWKVHKKTCKPCVRARPFHALDDGTWLHGRPTRDVYTLLIDSYRLRMEDEYALEQENNNDSHYSGNGTPAAIRGLAKFLTRIEKRHRNLLPDWWTAESRKDCEALAKDSSQWADISCTVEKSDIIDHYKDTTMPMQLRMLAEEVYDRGLGGQNGETMRKMMMRGEE